MTHTAQTCPWAVFAVRPRNQLS